jgi:2,4-dienoyl-CoA reductase (NADPH2)
MNVKIQQCKKADMATIKKLKPDAVIAAVGGSPIVPGIPGVKERNVVVAEDVFDNKVKVGKEVVIIGGGTIGCEIGLHIAKMGAMKPDVACFLLKNNVIKGDELVELTSRGKRNITILEMKNKIGGRFGISTRWIILKQIKDAGINSITGVNVKEFKNINKPKASSNSKNIDEKIRITYEKDKRDNSLLADTVVIAAGYKSNQSLFKGLDGKIDELYKIGDCVSVRTALEAIHEGFEAGLKV